ncbi:cytochrome b [Cupriavidus sp. CV2]|uniref:cytochrome b n=1 Tax=Cupriavidus ulmosensis TaxID=3065913 RepID=UPI00296B0F42|nr:cytochrome b [Cupriavidus sp. CV2]MDW3680482.1 cytochrome b [Cupriavidus sp. CV2]
MHSQAKASARAPAAPAPLSASAYGATAIGLHWIIALLIFAAFGLGLYMTSIPGLSMLKLKLFSWHKWIGVTIFAFAVLRVLWRATHRVPAPAAGTPAWQAKAAHVAHLLLYALIVVVPITGYLYSSASGVPVVYLGIWQLPALIEKNDELKEILKLVHIWLNYLMAVIVVVHAAAAIKHQFIERDGTLARMLPFLK